MPCPAGPQAQIWQFQGTEAQDSAKACCCALGQALGRKGDWPPPLPCLAGLPPETFHHEPGFLATRARAHGEGFWGKSSPKPALRGHTRPAEEGCWAEMGGGDLPGRGWGPGEAGERSSGRQSSPGSTFHLSPARRQPWARHSPPESFTAWWWGRGWWSSSAIGGAGIGAGDKTQYAPLGTRGEGCESARPSPGHRERGTPLRPPEVRARSPGRSFGALVPLTPWPLASSLALSLPLRTSASPPGLGALVPPKAPPDASAPLDRGPRRRRRARPALRPPQPVTCTPESGARTRAPPLPPATAGPSQTRGAADGARLSLPPADSPLEAGPRWGRTEGRSWARKSGTRLAGAPQVARLAEPDAAGGRAPAGSSGAGKGASGPAHRPMLLPPGLDPPTSCSPRPLEVPRGLYTLCHVGHASKAEDPS